MIGRRYKVRDTAAVMVLVFAALPAWGHHAVKAQFDMYKPIELTGVLTKMEWINPHPYMHLDVTDENGKARLRTVTVFRARP